MNERAVEPRVVRASWTASAADGVVLVGVRLRNPTPVVRAVRVESRLDGSVMPPRSSGVPERGWDDDGFSGVVEPGTGRALGFAVAAPLERPPVEVVDRGRADDAAAEADATTPAEVCRTLGSPRPPRDAIPLPDPEPLPDRAPRRERPRGVDGAGAGSGSATGTRRGGHEVAASRQRGAGEGPAASPGRTGPASLEADGGRAAGERPGDDGDEGAPADCAAPRDGDGARGQSDDGPDDVGFEGVDEPVDGGGGDGSSIDVDDFRWGVQ
jgi:hypothetical protein